MRTPSLGGRGKGEGDRTNPKVRQYMHQIFPSADRSELTAIGLSMGFATRSRMLHVAAFFLPKNLTDDRGYRLRTLGISST